MENYISRNNLYTRKAYPNCLFPQNKKEGAPGYKLICKIWPII